MKNISGLYLAFLALFTNNAHARMCELDPNFPDQLCTKVSYVDSSVELIRSYKEGKWVYQNTYKDLTTGKEWPVLLFERKKLIDAYALLDLSDVRCYEPSMGSVVIMSEEQCIKWNAEREASRKLREKEELEEKLLRQNPELKYVLYIPIFKIKDSYELALLLVTKKNRKFRGIDFSNFNFGARDQHDNLAVKSKIKLGPSKDKKEYRFVTLDKDNNILEEMNFNTDYKDKRTSKKLKSTSVFIYLEKLVAVKKVQFFQNDKLVIEKEFNHSTAHEFQ